MHLPVEAEVALLMHQHWLRQAEEEAEKLTTEVRRRLILWGGRSAHFLDAWAYQRALVVALRRAYDKEHELKDALFKAQQERSWRLTEGELRGDWLQCANRHDCYSESPEDEPEWRKQTLLGREFWLCSARCAQEWWEKETAKLEAQPVSRAEVTLVGGRKITMRTSGQSLGGATLGTVEGPPSIDKYLRASTPLEESQDREKGDQDGGEEDRASQGGENSRSTVGGSGEAP